MIKWLSFSSHGDISLQSVSFIYWFEKIIGYSYSKIQDSLAPAKVLKSIRWFLFKIQWQNWTDICNSQKRWKKSFGICARDKDKKMTINTQASILKIICLEELKVFLKWIFRKIIVFKFCFLMYFDIYHLLLSRLWILSSSAHL